MSRKSHDGAHERRGGVTVVMVIMLMLLMDDGYDVFVQNCAFLDLSQNVKRSTF